MILHSSLLVYKGSSWIVLGLTSGVKRVSAVSLRLLMTDKTRRSVPTQNSRMMIDGLHVSLDCMGEALPLLRSWDGVPFERQKRVRVASS